MTARIFAVVFMLFSVFPVHAVDGIAVSGGDGLDDSAVPVRVHFIWELDYPLFTDGQWYVQPYLEASAGYWDVSGGDNVSELSLTPVLRLQGKSMGPGLNWFAELGIAGGHVLSETRIAGKDISSAFQFGSHIGGGVRFGDKQQWELMYRLQHLSNAGIETPNPGVDFHIIRLGYWF